MLINRTFARDQVLGGERYSSFGDSIGKTARRTLLPNQPIPREAVRGTLVILSGQATRLVYEFGGLRVTADGLALNSAAVGEVVQVRNLTSGTTVTGIAAMDRSVLVNDK
jgi:flagella basal body P-ring formation protein FlgA